MILNIGTLVIVSGEITLPETDVIYVTLECEEENDGPTANS